MIFKKLFFTFTTTLFLFLGCAIAERGHHIHVQVHGIQDTTALLAYHHGQRQYIADTAQVDHAGRFHFQGDEALDKGMYMIVLPGQVYFEILMDHNQHFGVSTQMNEFVNTMEFDNSPDNEAFYEYMRFIGELNQVSRPLREELQDESISAARREEIRTLLARQDQKVAEKQNQLIEEFPDGLFSAILRAQQEPQIPDLPPLPDGRPDQQAMYQLYKNAFWENIDFSDDRLVRTPIYHAKLNQYFTRVIMQIPDTVIAEADRIVEKARANSEMFTFTVFTLTNMFERSQIMGMDAAFVHMVEQYYMSGEADWVTEEQLSAITERAMALKPLLIGKTAPDITMFTTDRKPLSLHDIEAKFTLVYFWDSECGHCKRQTPLLKEFYERMHPKGVEIFAANTEADRSKWIGYIEKNELPWIHVNDPANQSGFRDKYDIWATPLIFLLDENKEIIAKRITVEQAEEIITMKMQGN